MDNQSVWTIVISIVALIQVWVIEAYRKFIKKGKVEIYNTGSLEIGYSNYGPSLAFNGTLRAIHKDVFIKTIEIKVIRIKDKAEHIFQWVAFRSPKINFSKADRTDMELASSFLVTPDSPKRINIFFSDTNHYQEFLYPKMQELNKAINDKYRTKCKELENSEYQNPDDEHFKQEFQATARDMESYLDTYDSIMSKCYWDSGDYKLFINCHASKPDCIYSQAFDFTILEQDSNSLRGNSLFIVELPVSILLNTSSPTYLHFAYSSLVPDDTQLTP